MNTDRRIIRFWGPALVAAALVIMYAPVLAKLGLDWSTDGNYSHGLLVPPIAAYIIWQKREWLKQAASTRGERIGWLLLAAAVVLLLLGTLAAVLVVQRFSLVVILAGVVLVFFGVRVLSQLVVPFLLFILSIPVPQLLFNKIAFPLQLLASGVADASLGLLGIASDRMGNVIDITSSLGEVVSLEVVEACSGIRSLVTLATLGLLLGYFTRGPADHEAPPRLSRKDVQRTTLLMVAAVPIALITNAARVVVTGIGVYYRGEDAAESFLHDISGSATFVAAVLLLIGLNILLKRILGKDDRPLYRETDVEAVPWPVPSMTSARIAAVVSVIGVAGLAVNWFQIRGEADVHRMPLNEMSGKLGNWERRNEDIRFDPDTEKVLRATDYVMRDYYGPGKRLNVYVGYYASQRSGSTYHSPLSCLPGTGWEMTDRELLEIETPRGKRLVVNRYVVSQGDHREFLIYWYQGRGRTFTSEYTDKIYTSLDSIFRRRSDGGIVRVMTPFGSDPDRSLAAAIDLTGRLADEIGKFLPD